jgi:hypothetical protein
LSYHTKPVIPESCFGKISGICVFRKVDFPILIKGVSKDISFVIPNGCEESLVPVLVFEIIHARCPMLFKGSLQDDKNMVSRDM